MGAARVVIGDGYIKGKIEEEEKEEEGDQRGFCDFEG